MLEIITLIAAPTITAFLAPLILTWVNRVLNARKEAKKISFAEEQYNDKLASDLRQELRNENHYLKENNAILQKRISEAAESLIEVDAWKKKFYALKKEKQSLEFELSLLRQELEYIRRQYEEYRAVRERAERNFGDDNGSNL